MEEKDQTHLNPLPPSITKNLKSDELESPTYHPFNPPPRGRHQNRNSKCLVYVLLAVVLHGIAFLIFGLVVLRVKTPTLRLSTAAVNGLSYIPTSLNMTIAAAVRLRNMNFGRFEFRGGNAILLYGNATIGVGSIYEGRVGSRERREMNVTVRVNYMNLSGYNNIGLGNNLIRLRSFAKLRGEVRVLNMINRRRSAAMNCTMDLNMTSHEIQDLSCQ